MKTELSDDSLPNKALLISCSSHEGRCRGLIERTTHWSPENALLFHYDDDNPRREKNHQFLVSNLRKRGVVTQDLTFTELSASLSLSRNIRFLLSAINDASIENIVIDISVLTKRHLFMMLQWIDDFGFWDRLTIVYTEPEEYDVSEFIPLSFGLRSIQHIPGLPAATDLSRPVHLVLFLGYEGDRALASYEHVQPMVTTVVITHPPYREDWQGRSEALNQDFLALCGSQSQRLVDGIDPYETVVALQEIFTGSTSESEYAKIICPIGTKPQAVGIFSYLRSCIDTPAIVYASPFRHNHRFFSHGVGKSWILSDRCE